MIVQVLTVFPELIEAWCRHGIVERAIRRRVVEVRAIGLRAYAGNRHGKIDDRPFGGGPGMVMCCEPVDQAVRAAEKGVGEARKIVLSPRGRMLDRDMVRKLAAEEHLLLLCGRYEGIDARVLDEWDFEAVSIGDYVLTGGELPALALLEAVVRWLPGALGHADSPRREVLVKEGEELPQYTRPAIWKGRRVPEALLSGHHGKVATFRRNATLKGEPRT